MAGEILLINVSGVDKPGLMTMLTSALAEYQVRILDLGQAIIHDTLGLGMLIEVPAGVDTEAVVKDLMAVAEAQDAPVRYTRISKDRYQNWVTGLDQHRHIITLLSDDVSAAQLAAVSAITLKYGLNIETVRRLTGRVGLENMGQSNRTGIEIGVRGVLSRPDELKAELLAKAGELVFDFSVQRDTVYRRNRRLVAFDMDSTLINAEVMDELAKLHGVGEQVAAITELAMTGEIDFQTSFRHRAKLLKGLPETALKTVAGRVSLNEGGPRLLAALKQFGFKIAIISGGFQYVGEWLQERLGIDYVFANRLAVQDGVITGEVVGDIIDASRKAEILAQIAAQEGISLQQTIAIGDGANDLPMLSAAGLGVAYHAKPLVKQTASHTISHFGLDSVLYLLGFTDSDIEQVLAGG